VTGTCGSMGESIHVSRQCYLGKNTGYVSFRISWTMPDGNTIHDDKFFDGLELLDMPMGSVPMLTHIYCLPHEGHPGACTLGIAYLIRVYDFENELQDVVARFWLRPNRHDIDPDAAFACGPLDEEGPNIFPLAIEDPDEP
jgi:hypothetical protein